MLKVAFFNTNSSLFKGQQILSCLRHHFHLLDVLGQFCHITFFFFSIGCFQIHFKFCFKHFSVQEIEAIVTLTKHVAATFKLSTWDAKISSTHLDHWWNRDGTFLNLNGRLIFSKWGEESWVEVEVVCLSFSYFKSSLSIYICMMEYLYPAKDAENFLSNLGMVVLPGHSWTLSPAWSLTYTDSSQDPSWISIYL